MAAAGLLGLGSAGRAIAQASAPQPVAPPLPLGPDTPLGNGTDGPVTLADLPDRPLVVCFWASWCPYCRAELPVLENVQQQIKPERLRVVLVNTEDSFDWRQLRRRMQDRYTALLTNDAGRGVRKAFGAPDSVPYTVVLGRDGRRQAALRGWGEGSADQLVEAINAALLAPAAGR